MSKKKIFKFKLLKWAEFNTRQYSWRNSNDPWKILLIEIISQQTQLERANKYYEKFIKKFPNPKKMSSSSKKQILKMWSGLGYNNRAIRMHEASKILTKRSFDSIYPDFDILPGVGKYTKDALLSFAYDEQIITQDTNVIRIFSRFFGVEKPDIFIEKNQDFFLENVKSRKFNQALMDFGSKICKTNNPLCNECIFSKDCKKFYSKTKYTQSTFRGSDREVRGKIIKYLLNNKNVDIFSLSKTLEIEESRLTRIINKLSNDGLIDIKNKKLIEISS